MYKLDKDDFIKTLEVKKPEIVEWKSYLTFFVVQKFRFFHNEYYYETSCLDCWISMQNYIKELKIKLIEIDN